MRFARWAKMFCRSFKKRWVLDSELQLGRIDRQIGSGALPTEELPTLVISIEHQKHERQLDRAKIPRRQSADYRPD